MITRLRLLHADRLPFCILPRHTETKIGVTRFVHARRDVDAESPSMPPIMAAAAARIMIIIAAATAFFVVISAAAVFLMIFIAAATGIVVAAWHGAATAWSMAAIVVVAAAAAIVVVAATITTVISAAATITSTCVNKTEGIPRSEFDQVAIIYRAILPQSATRTLFGVLFHQIGRLKELESENARLKKIVAQQALDIDALKELLRKKRPQETHLQCFPTSHSPWVVNDHPRQGANAGRGS